MEPAVSFLSDLSLAPPSDPWFYAIAIPAVVLTGVSKGGFGGTVGMLGTPLMALAVAPIQAAAIMLPILCAMDLLGMLAYRGKAGFQHLVYLAPGALIGIAIGTASFRYLNDDLIRILIGTLTWGFLMFSFFRARLGAQDPVGPSAPKGVFWGAASGFTSFVAHAGGPPAQIYLLPQKLGKTVLVGTLVWFFFIVNYVKLVPYFYLGQFSPTNLGAALVLAPLAPVGIGLGVWLHKRIPEALFFRIIYVALFLVGAKLLYDGAAGMTAG
ncbi:MAG: sulfite exporter TauE/SafE family protein [Alphaproteobacteria bacterium]|nr:sulfite exporter TauE/SafE family protein [Alphaproteobacteria bacterium]